MIVTVCYPCFDTRFYREPVAEGDVEPGWLFLDPPRYPGLERAGGLGAIKATIPPSRYASCAADQLIRLAALTDPAPDLDQAAQAAGGTSVQLSGPQIMVWADPRGHVRLTVAFEARLEAPGADLGATLEAVMSAAIGIRHPERRGVYVTLAEAANDLADCYGRETARTTPPPRGGYRLDWVRAGRPFITVVAQAAEKLAVGGATFDGPIIDKQFDGHIRFVPWQSQGGSQDVSLPVWLLVPQRGGGKWIAVANAIETYMSHLEEFVVCLQATESGLLRPAEGGERSVLLRRYIAARRGYLGRETLAGLNLPLILRLIADYERTEDQSRKRHASGLDALVQERVSAIIADTVCPQDRSAAMTLRIANMNVTVGGTGNIVNLGEMIANTIATTNSALQDAKATDDLKQSLEQLRGPVTDAAAKLPPEEARELLEDYETFTKQALRSSPNAGVVKAQGDSIVSAVSKVAGLATPIVGLVAAVVKILGF